jgi:predicted DNA-binding transcriptional regulator AlpA
MPGGFFFGGVGVAKFKVDLQDKLLLNMDEVAAVLGIGRDLLYRLLLEIEPRTSKPRLHSVRIGRRRMVSRRALEIFILQEGE